MTKYLADTLGLPHLEDALREQGVTPAPPAPRATAPASPPAPAHSKDLVTDDLGHGKKMDLVYAETLDHAQKVMDLGYNIDPSRAPRMFEVAAGLYKVALDAANSKRDAQLKAIKLMQDQQKIDLERAAGSAAGGGTIEAQAMIVEDRNELLKRLRAEAKKSD